MWKKIEILWKEPSYFGILFFYGKGYYERIMISKEDLEKYFGNRKVINKEEYIKYLYDNKKLK